MKKKNLNAIEYLESKMSAEEIDEVNLATAIASELVKARGELGISQKELESLTGIKQPMITRIERGNVSPTLLTISKLLRPLGKKLIVVPA